MRSFYSFTYYYIDIKPLSILNKKTYYPSLALQDYVENYTIVEYQKGDEDAVKILDFPRTAMDIVFCFDGSIALNLDKQQSLKINRASFMGNFDKPYEIAFSPKLSILHVKFKVKGIYPLTKIPLEHIVNQQLPIKELISASADEIYQRMGETDSAQERIEMLENFLLSTYCRSNMNFRLNHAIDLIQKKKGMISVKQLSEELNTNYKSLERWFKTKVGLAPKKFSSVTRFKNILDDIDSSSSPSWMDYVVDYGFHDQSHFIRSFEEFSGLTPESYWNKKSSV